MRSEEILSLLRNSGALLEGHFLLSSGKHSSKYVQCSLVLQNPGACERLCTVLAEYWKDAGVDVVVAPAIGGIVLSYEMARSLGARGVFMERAGDGKLALRRGFEISPDEKVLVTEDVITTGGSVKEIIERVRGIGAEVLGVAAIVDRSGGRVEFGCPIESCTRLEMPVYDSHSCPMCRNGAPIVKPGSRNITDTD